MWAMGSAGGLLAGSITPVYTDAYTPGLYIYTDSTGAEYRLTNNNNGVWTSNDGIYVTFDSSTRKLWFNDGSFWQMGSESAGTEEDSGTLYPTLMEDSNGNQITLTYNAGKNWYGNSSSRISAIYDVVTATPAYGGAPTYTFLYDQGAYPAGDTRNVPHLNFIRGPSASGSANFYYTHNLPLRSPIDNADFGYATYLTGVLKVPLSRNHTFEYQNTELWKWTTPYGGYVAWDYRNFTFTGSRTLREMSARYYYAKQPGENQHLTHVYHDDANDALRTYHVATMLWDDSGKGQKMWWFYPDHRLARLDERNNAGVVKVQHDYVWNTSGNPYVSQATTTLEADSPMPAVKRTQQTLDGFGNLTQMTQYDFGLSASTAKTFVNTYLATSAYTGVYIRNRLLQSTVSVGGGTPLTLVQNQYDQYPTTCSSLGYYPAPDATQIRLFDLAVYGPSVTSTKRGNLTNQSSFGSTVCSVYNWTGTARLSRDVTGGGGITTVQTNLTQQYAVPTAVTANGYGVNLNWNSLLQLNSQTDPNGDVSSAVWGGGDRPMSTTSPYGAVTNYTYSEGDAVNNGVTTATTNGRWVKMYLDGFGRTMKTVSGYGSGGGAVQDSIVERTYEPCACSALGKLKKVSQPYRPGQTPVWTVYDYDYLGRTLSVTYPPNTGTAGNSGATQYAYSGNAVTVSAPG